MTLPIKPIEELLGVTIQPGVQRGPIAINLVLEEAGTGARVGADVAFKASISFRNRASPNAKPEPNIYTKALQQQVLQGWVRAGVRQVGTNTFALVLRPGQLAAGAGGEPSNKPGGAQASSAPSQLQQGPAAGGEGQDRQLKAGGRRAGTPRQRAAMAAAAAGGERQRGGQGRLRLRAPEVSPTGHTSSPPLPSPPLPPKSAWIACSAPVAPPLGWGGG
jgi:hypothetical protein